MESQYKISPIVEECFQCTIRGDGWPSHARNGQKEYIDLIHDWGPLPIPESIPEKSNLSFEELIPEWYRHHYLLDLKDEAIFRLIGKVSEDYFLQNFCNSYQIEKIKDRWQHRGIELISIEFLGFYQD